MVFKRSLAIVALVLSSSQSWAHIGPHDGDGNDLPIPGREAENRPAPAFTYTVLDDSQPGGPAGSAIPRPPNAVEVPFSDDSVQGPYALPFPFNFYGEVVTQFWASSNGFVSFDAPPHAFCCSGRPLPHQAGPALSVFGYWTDWNPSSGWYGVSGNPGSRVFTWTHSGREIGNPDQTMTWQMQVREGSGNVDLFFVSNHDSQRVITVGVQNRAGDQATTYRHGRFGIPALRMVRFSPGNEPPEIRLLSGLIDGGQTHVNGEWQLTVAVLDPEGQETSLRVDEDAPETLHVQSLGDGSWRLLDRPISAREAPESFQLIASDGIAESEVTVSYTVNAPENEAPAIVVDSGDHEVVDGSIILLTTGDELVMTATATDREDGPIDVQPAEAMPSDMSFEAGEIRWTPSDRDTGEYDLPLTARDSGGARGRYTVTLRVRRSNTGPRFLSEPPVNLPVGQDLAYAIHGDDDDLSQGDRVELSLAQGPSSALIDEDAVLHFTPIEAERGSVIGMELVLRDQMGLEARQHLELSIGVSNEAPLALAGEDFSADPGTIELRGNGQGPGPYQFAWEALQTPNNVDPQLNDAEEQTARFTATAAGSYTFRLKVSNGTFSGQHDDVVVTVNDLGPMIRLDLPSTGLTDQAIQAVATAEDPNGDPIDSLVWSVSPEGMNVDGDDAEVSLTATAVGTYKVVVSAKSSGGEAQAEASIVIEQNPGCGCVGTGEAPGWLLLLGWVAAARRRRRAA